MPIFVPDIMKKTDRTNSFTHTNYFKNKAEK